MILSVIKGFRVEPFNVDYTRDFIEGVEHFRPRVAVRLQNGQYSFRTAMLLDSGADISLIPFDVAEVLQLRLGEETKNNIGPSGKFSVTKSDVELWLSINRKEICLGNIPVTIPVNRLTDDAADEVQFCLLGRDPFFEIYDITFQESWKRVHFQPSKKPPPHFGATKD